MENNKNYEWQHDAVRLDETGVLSRREIAKLLKVPRSTCLDFLREYQKFKNAPEDEVHVAPKDKVHDNSRILFISDMHIPYHHKNLLPFLEMLKNRYDPTRVIILGDECFPPDVEVLTEDGFVRFDCLKDQKVAQWREDSQIEFVVPERKIEKPFCGVLLQQKHRTLTIRTTPKHNLVKIHPTHGTVHKREAWDSYGNESWFIPRTGKHNGIGIDLSDDEIRMMVAFQADGTFTKGAARFQFSKERKIERWLALAKSIGLRFNEHEIIRGDVRQFYIEVANVPRYFEKEFKIPVTKFSLHQKEVFLRELEYWDGTKVKNGVRYVSSSKPNVEYVFLMAVTAGYVPSKILNANGDGSCVATDIIWKRENCSLKSAEKTEVPHSGLVYCVTVPSGMIVVRTDGYVSISGNCDKHAMSFHDSDPDLFSAGHELEKALPVIKEVENLYPVADVIDSNHGSMIYRKAKHHGVPRRYIKSYNDVLEVGDGWVWHNDLTIELPDGQKVYIHHGKSSEAIKTSQAMAMSHVCGHYHESFGIKYWANPNGLFWAMNTGCLIDDKSLAFQYNNVNLKRPIIGTGLIIDGYPVLEAMPL